MIRPQHHYNMPIILGNTLFRHFWPNIRPSEFKHRKGAVISGNFEIEKGTVLLVAVGQKGNYKSSGSGGTFVIQKACRDVLVPIVIAGGAGGHLNFKMNSWCSAQLEEYGNGPNQQNNTNLGSSGPGEKDGAGFYSLHPNFQSSHRPKCFKSGMTGGELSSRK